MPIVTHHHRTTVLQIGAAFVLGVALGLAGGVLGPFHQTAAVEDTGAGSQATDTRTATQANWADWVQSTPWDQPDFAALETVAPRLADQPTLVEATLARFRREPAGEAKLNLLQFLTNTPIAQVTAQAVTWASDASDLTVRRDGLQLLSLLPPSAEAVQLARAALDQETDPQALAYALVAFRPEAPFDPQEVRVRVEQFHRLTQHPLAAVRAGSIQRLAEWDRAERYLPADVMRLLDDPDNETRMAAIGATSLAGLKGDALKKRLLDILVNPKEDPVVRAVVEMQMYRFALSPEEHRAWVAGSAQLAQAAQELAEPKAR